MAKKDENNFWLNARGEAVHPDNVRADEKLKDELVEQILEKVGQKEEELRKLKEDATKDIEDYFELLLQQYKIDGKKKSKKGNITLENFSGTKKVQIAMAETLSFDEKLNVAKIKIDEFLTDITKDAPPTIKTLVTQAFEVDKKGNIDAKRIFALKSYDIEDPRWIEAMTIIDDSKRVSRIKPYIRFYERDSIEDNWEFKKLDIAMV